MGTLSPLPGLVSPLTRGSVFDSHTSHPMVRVPWILHEGKLRNAKGILTEVTRDCLDGRLFKFCSQVGKARRMHVKHIFTSFTVPYPHAKALQQSEEQERRRSNESACGMQLIKEACHFFGHVLVGQISDNYILLIIGMRRHRGWKWR